MYDPYRNLINELFPNDHFHIVVQAYMVLKTTYCEGTHEYRALKRYAKLIMTSNEKLDFTHYYPRINFKHAWLSSPEVVEQLLRMSDDLRIAYEYYQDVLYIISQHDVKELDRLLEENIHDLPIALTKH